MNKNKVIIGLLAAAVIVFGVIRFGVIPANQVKQTEYANDQTDALTHDISVVEDFKSPYVGNASNVANLFYSLPLCNISMEFQIDSEACALTVSYHDTVENLGVEKVRRDLLYNSIAAMAAVDNLSAITYRFSDNAYSFEREEIEAGFGTPLSGLLNQETWTQRVQSKLSSADFVEPFYAD